MRRLLVVALYIGSAMAQTVLDYSKLPACAKQCTVLAQAEGGCVPPAAPVTSQGIYQSCVCQSALLTQLHTSGAVCQTTGCSADDAAKITTYYNALCAGPVVEPAPTTTLVTTSSSTATGTATAGAAGGVKNASTAKTDWVSTHKGWLAFAVIFVVLFFSFLFGGLFWKKHHNRKRDAARANVAAHDAPFNPPAPGTARSLPSILRGSSSKVNGSVSTINGTTPPPPMTAMSGRSGMTMDGGVGGIAPPRGPNKLRSRSSTLQSLGLGNGQARQPDPIAWGPHQHQAHYNANNHGSPGSSVPPSPVSGISPPNPVYRNRDHGNSEPRFSNYSTFEQPGRTVSPLPDAAVTERPHTAGSANKITKKREYVPLSDAREANGHARNRLPPDLVRMRHEEDKLRIAARRAGWKGSHFSCPPNFGERKPLLENQD